MTKEEKQALYRKWYQVSRTGRAARKRYQQSPKGKAAAKRANARYFSSPKGQATLAKYREARKRQVSAS